MENVIKPQVENTPPADEEPVNPPAPEKEKKGFPRLRWSDKYLRYIVFAVAIGLVFIWNSHFAEGLVREEEELKQKIYDAKAQYKTLHARLSQGTRRSAIEAKADTLLGLRSYPQAPFIIRKDEP